MFGRRKTATIASANGNSALSRSWNAAGGDFTAEFTVCLGEQGLANNFLAMWAGNGTVGGSLLVTENAVQWGLDGVLIGDALAGNANAEVLKDRLLLGAYTSSQASYADISEITFETGAAYAPGSLLPEPSSAALLMSAMGLLARRRRKRAKDRHCTHAARREKTSRAPSKKA